MLRLRLGLPVLSLYLLLLGATPLQSQSYLFNKLDLAVGKAPQSVAVGDFNNDGMPDFAVANNGDDTVSVFLGQRNGLFKALTPISTGASSAPYALAVADFDGDGKLDLAVVLFGANTVAISLVGIGHGGMRHNLPLSVDSIDHNEGCRSPGLRSLRRAGYRQRSYVPRN